MLLHRPLKPKALDELETGELVRIGYNHQSSNEKSCVAITCRIEIMQKQETTFLVLPPLGSTERPFHLFGDFGEMYSASYGNEWTLDLSPSIEPASVRIEPKLGDIFSDEKSTYIAFGERAGFPSAIRGTVIFDLGSQARVREYGTPIYVYDKWRILVPGLSQTHGEHLKLYERQQR